MFWLRSLQKKKFFKILNLFLFFGTFLTVKAFTLKAKTMLETPELCSQNLMLLLKDDKSSIVQNGKAMVLTSNPPPPSHVTKVNKFCQTYAWKNEENLIRFVSLDSRKCYMQYHCYDIHISIWYPPISEFSSKVRTRKRGRIARIPSSSCPPSRRPRRLLARRGTPSNERARAYTCSHNITRPPHTLRYTLRSLLCVPLYRMYFSRYSYRHSSKPLLDQ